MVTGFIKQKSHLIRDTFEAHGKSISILTKVLVCIQTKITDSIFNRQVNYFNREV